MGKAPSRVTPAVQSTTVAHSSAAQRSAAVSTSATGANRRFNLPGAAGPQSLIMPTMVALGCWGMAFSFAFFYNDPNHFIFAAMAALMALLWTYSVAVRVRKSRIARQKGM
ncbi:MAG: hypothetical protein NVS3B14_09090 [Ktedonobacteraceae bacterium]